MSRQMLLPGIPTKPTRAEIRGMIRNRLFGLELRQAVRIAKRASRQEKRRKARELVA